MTDDDAKSACDAGWGDRQCWRWFQLALVAGTSFTTRFSDGLFAQFWDDSSSTDVPYSLSASGSSDLQDSAESNKVKFSASSALFSAYNCKHSSVYFRRRPFRRIASFSSCRNLANYNKTNTEFNNIVFQWLIISAKKNLLHISITICFCSQVAVYYNFSERQLMFKFAICHRPSVCRLSVMFVRPT